jgi:pimeloyl-ACP methyl ester carboxylesterase
VANIVIVHGAFGGGWEWREVARLLRERVHLATPETSLETHIQDIVNVIRYEDLYHVILACQSYGGMVATGVANRVPERLAHLVYLNALVPEDGQSVFDLTPPAFRRRFEEATQATGEGWRIPAPAFEDDPVIAAFSRGRYVATPLLPFTEPIRLGPLPDDLARTYIWCTADQEGLSGVADLMRPFAERARHDPRWRFHQLDAIPDAYIHIPHTVADLFDAAAHAG